MFDHHDAYKPTEIATMIENAGVAKAALPALQMFTLAVLAGAFIGFGGLAWLQVMNGADMAYGPIRLLGGVAFSLGLILVIVGGAELFTGNALMVMAAVDGKITVPALLRNWGIVFAGNLLGALGLALAAHLAGLDGKAAAETLATMAQAKLSLSTESAFLRGALCNALVCLAVWLSFAARNATDKILAIIFPVATFVALGLEHSIANMMLLPLAALSGANVPLGGMVENIVVVTLGNLVGGAGGVALAYRFAYRPGGKS